MHITSAPRVVARAQVATLRACKRCCRTRDGGGRCPSDLFSLTCQLEERGGDAARRLPARPGLGLLSNTAHRPPHSCDLPKDAAVYSGCGTLKGGGCAADGLAFYGPVTARPIGERPLWYSSRHGERHDRADRANKPLARSAWHAKPLPITMHATCTRLLQRSSSDVELKRKCAPSLPGRLS